MPEIYYQSVALDGESIEFKKIMAASIEDWIKRDRKGRSKKVLAGMLGVDGDTLSHWISLSPKQGSTMPGHLVRRFCAFIGSWALLRWQNGEKVS